LVGWSACHAVSNCISNRSSFLIEKFVQNQFLALLGRRPVFVCIWKEKRQVDNTQHSVRCKNILRNHFSSKSQTNCWNCYRIEGIILLSTTRTKAPQVDSLRVGRATADLNLSLPHSLDFFACAIATTGQAQRATRMDRVLTQRPTNDPRSC
jgi:hypothetical protein